MINKVIFGDKDKTNNNKKFEKPVTEENNNIHKHIVKNTKSSKYEMGKGCLSLSNKIGKLSDDQREDLIYRTALMYLIKRGDVILASEIHDEIIKDGVSKENKVLLHKYYKMAKGIMEKPIMLSGINFKIYTIIETMSYILSEDTISEDIIMNNILRGEHILSVGGQIKTYTTMQLLDMMKDIIADGGKVNPIIKRKCRFLVDGKSYISLSRFYEIMNG